MRSIDFVTALGRLLSDPTLLNEFSINPHRVADTLNICNDERNQFVTLSATHLATQAKLLVTKRMKEVYKHMPLTFSTSETDTAVHFKAYASTVWPHSHRRHLEDAYQFFQYLKAHRIPIRQSEYNHVNFLRSGRRLSFALARDVFIKGRPLPAIQLFYRHKAAIGQWQFYLKA